MMKSAGQLPVIPSLPTYGGGGPYL